MKYHLHVTGKDSIGHSWLENVIAMANLGATIKEGTMPFMRFPHSVSMSLESEEVPFTSASVRAFIDETGEEVFNVPEIVPAKFSMGDDDELSPKEKLDALSWDELKALAKEVGITGRDRNKVTKEYLAKIEEKVEVSE